MILVVVPGFNSDNGKNTTKPLANALRSLGYKVHEFHYGDADLWDVFFANENFAQSLASFIYQFNEPVCAIGHSNGCALIHEAACILDAPEELNRAIYFSPALPRKTCPPQNLKKVLVFKTRSDLAVRLSTYLPCFPWGRMGAFGPLRMDNYVVVDGYPAVKGHSDWFLNGGISFSLPHVQAFLEEAACHG